MGPKVQAVTEKMEGGFGWRRDNEEEEDNDKIGVWGG